MKQDNINPKHYRQGKIEVIKIMEDQLSNEEFKGFCKGLILKYILRADYKNGIEDYEKAQWYLKHLIKKLKGEKHEDC
jgi:hypothetical protein